MSIEQRVDPHTPLIIADFSRVVQVLYNLLGNALKFTKAGHVRVTVAPRDRTGTYVTIRVEDTGIGIPKDKINSIWGAFEQVGEDAVRVCDCVCVCVTVRHGCTRVEVCVCVCVCYTCSSQVDMSVTRKYGGTGLGTHTHTHIPAHTSTLKLLAKHACMPALRLSGALICKHVAVPLHTYMHLCKHTRCRSQHSQAARGEP